MDNEKRNISSECMIQIGEYLYFTELCGPYFYRSKINDGHVELVARFQEREIWGRYFSKIIQFNDKLYLIPLAYDVIVVFDMISEEIEYIDLPQRNFKGGKFSNAFVRTEFLFMIPAFYPGILIMNLIDNSFEVYDEWIEDEEYISCVMQREAYFRGEFVEEGETFYLPMCNAHAIFEFTPDKKYKIYNVGRYGYSAMAVVKNVFYLAPRSGDVITKWDKKSNQIYEIDSLPAKYNNKSFLGSAISDKYIWFFPERANMVLRIDICSDEVDEELLFSAACKCPIKKTSGWDSAFIYKEQKEKYVLLCAPKNNRFIKFYANEKKIEQFKITIDGATNEQCRFETLKTYPYCLPGRKFSYEWSEYTIEDFIDDTIERT